MKKITNLLLAFFILLQFSSCIGYSIKSAFIPNKGVSYHKLDKPRKDWERLIIYDVLDPADSIQEIITIVVTGTASTSEEKLLQEIKKEASKFSADAILHVETREVLRQTFDGISASVSLISLFADPDNYVELEISGAYYALEVEGIAIRFMED